MSQIRVKILRTTVADGQRVEKGDTPEISEKAARYLFSLRKAEPAPLAPKRRQKKADQ